MRKMVGTKQNFIVIKNKMEKVHFINALTINISKDLPHSFKEIWTLPSAVYYISSIYSQREIVFA